MTRVVRSVRFSGLSAFMRASDEERKLSTEVGVITYPDKEHYEVTSITLGARCDHAANPIASWTNGEEETRLTVANPQSSDAELLMDSDTRSIYRRDGVDVDVAAERKALEDVRKENKQQVAA